jgi:hypothetical protein
MRKLHPDRKARFKAALALAKIGVEEWAKEAGITRQHLNATLNDKRQSGTLIEKVDAFIAEVESGKITAVAKAS